MIGNQIRITQKKSRDERGLDSDTTGENAILNRDRLSFVDYHSVESGQQRLGLLKFSTYSGARCLLFINNLGNLCADTTER